MALQVYTHYGCETTGYVNESGNRVLTFAETDLGGYTVEGRLVGPGGQIVAADKAAYDANWQSVGVRSTTWLLPDHQGTVRDLVTKPDGGAITHQTVEFGIFGGPQNTDVAAVYAGQEFDAATGLYLAGGRWYDPVMGRFITEDPRGVLGSSDTNLYRFGNNSPINVIDTPVAQPGSSFWEDFGWYLNPLHNDPGIGGVAFGVGKGLGWLGFVGGTVAAGLLVAPEVIIGAEYAGAALAIYHNVAIQADDFYHNRPIDVTNTPLGNQFWSEMAATSGAAMTIVSGFAGAGAVGVPGWALQTTGLGLVGAGLYHELPAAYQQYQQGNYFQAAYHTGTSALLAYGGYRLRPRIGRSVPSAIAPRASLIEQPRDALGRFTPKVGGEVAPGSIAESATWDAVANKPGWTVTKGRIYVRDATGQVRVYDGYATSPSGRNIGLEVKSGTGRLTPDQRAFDTRLNSSRFNTATGIGENEDVIIKRAIEIRR